MPHFESSKQIERNCNKYLDSKRKEAKDKFMIFILSFLNIEK